jgi:hypothetical protein
MTMDYEELFDVVHEALAKRGVESHRIAGDVTRAVMRMIEQKAAQPRTPQEELDALSEKLAADHAKPQKVLRRK